MIIENNRKRADLGPRQQIPTDWASRGRCPLCAGQTLKLVHLSGQPDYLLCAPCELSFEVEQNNPFIRLKNIPESLGFVEDELRHNWVSPAALKSLLAERNAILQKKAGLAAAVSLSDETVWERTLALYRMGNKPRMVEFTLLQAGATREQTAAALLRLKNWAVIEEQQQGNRLLMVGAVTALLLIALFVSAWFYTTNRINSQLAEVNSNARNAGRPNTPLQVLNSLPDAIKPEFLKAPPARVDRVGPASAACPDDNIAAASLFGGDPQGWQPGSVPNSWQMVTTGKPSVIRVPSGMVAGYIDNTTFVFTSANGPATIYNVNFVAISCE